jgi:peptidoglycan/xylan/chitin deacetylase (PgdA/CDA1 family)
VKVLVTLSFLILNPLAFGKQLAITFDDSPRIAKGLFSGPERAKMLINSLKKVDSGPVVFFTVSDNMDEEGKERIRSYSDAGHFIANHTASHPNFNKTSADKYKTDFIRAHNALKDFKNFKSWFRFPYLKEGNTRLKRDDMRGTLRKFGYKNFYITMNNYDWYIERVFQKNRSHPNFDMNRMKEFYVNTLIESIDYYDEMAKKHLGRSPKHVLLLHEMDITALFIDDLILELRNQGWEIVSPEMAIEDEIANYETQTLFQYNPGRVGEIAHDYGQTTGLWHKSCNSEYIDQKFKENVLELND